MNVNEETAALIAEARRWANGHHNRRSGELMRDLADRLAALTTAQEASDKVFVALRGCDDSTVFALSVTESERELLEKVERISVHLGGGCKPSLEVTTALGEYEVLDGDGDEVAARSINEGEKQNEYRDS